jgi:hypothetical protein
MTTFNVPIDIYALNAVALTANATTKPTQATLNIDLPAPPSGANTLFITAVELASQDANAVKIAKGPWKMTSSTAAPAPQIRAGGVWSFTFDPTASPAPRIALTLQLEPDFAGCDIGTVAGAVSGSYGVT